MHVLNGTLRPKFKSLCPINNTHKYLNCLLCIVDNTSHINKTFDHYSHNRYTALKQKTALSLVTYYITYIHVTYKRSTIYGYEDAKFGNHIDKSCLQHTSYFHRRISLV
jgi:hypothetical protein